MRRVNKTKKKKPINRRNINGLFDNYVLEGIN